MLNLRKTFALDSLRQSRTLPPVQTRIIELPRIESPSPSREKSVAELVNALKHIQIRLARCEYDAAFDVSEDFICAYESRH